MFKPHNNPKIAEITASATKRSVSLVRLRPIDRDGNRYCSWCGEGEMRSRQQKYCSELCSSSAWAWFYPQKEWGLGVLLVRQEWRCKLCAYDWKPLAQNIHDEFYKRRGFSEPFALGTKVDWFILKRLKAQAPGDRRPEVDHVVPIFKGGASIGLDNHQAICNACHKGKTATDFKKS